MGYESQLVEAFNSMLRTDYIPLQDTDRLSLLADYYVDYMGYVGQILGPVDQLIVGRRGTGKTTLLYRALVECMRSWGDESAANMAKPRTLGVYIDLNKCQSISSSRNKDYEQFEYAFVSELCDSIREELTRSWPELTQDTSLFDRIFKAGEIRRNNAVNVELRRLADILQSGVPRFIDKSRPVEKQETVSAGRSEQAKLAITAESSKLAVAGGSELQTKEGYERVAKTSEVISYRLSVADLLRVIGQLRVAAGVPHFLIFVDEFSSLDKELQGRFTTLLKKILGNHSGVFVKLGAITDNYRLGSSIILQRDLFELSLDLDAYVERSGNLTAAMEGLERLTENIIMQRLRAYNIEIGSRLFDSPEEAWRDLSRAAMGVPRTLGIVLKQAWHRSQRPRIRRTDLDYGVRYAS